MFISRLIAKKYKTDGVLREKNKIKEQKLKINESDSFVEFKIVIGLRSDFTKSSRSHLSIKVF